MIVLPFLLIESLNMSRNAVVVTLAARRACSRPGIYSRIFFAATAKVSGQSSTISRSLTAYRLRLSVMVVGAAACAGESSGTGKTRFRLE